MRRASLILGLLVTVGCDGDPASAAPLEAAPRAADYRSPGVEREVGDASEVLRTRGFAEIGDPRRGFLVDHAANVTEQAMRAGTCYVALAASSPAMRELDVRIFDSDGGEVVQDTTTGSRAALRFCPSQSGTYFVTVQAAAGAGLFELRLFRGPTGLEIRIDDLFRGAPEPLREGR